MPLTARVPQIRMVANGRSWHTRDLGPKAAILTEADAPEAQGISLPDPKPTFRTSGLGLLGLHWLGSNDCFCV
jgi:hypothetical protein